MNKNSKNRLFAKNVRYLKTDNGFSYWYYNTEIVRVEGKKLHVKTDGYFTASTKRHINNICRIHGIPFYIFTKNYDHFYKFENLVYEWSDLKSTMVMTLGEV